MDIQDNDFTTIMKFVSKWEWADDPEGHPINDPVDPGGYTKYGISQRAFPTVRVPELTLEQALQIYWKNYWGVCTGIAVPLRWVVFDAAINQGISYALTIPKQTDDWRKAIGLRRERYLGLVEKKPALKKFIKGWLNRMNDLDKFISIQTDESSADPSSGSRLVTSLGGSRGSA